VKVVRPDDPQPRRRDGRRWLRRRASAQDEHSNERTDLPHACHSKRVIGVRVRYRKNIDAEDAENREDTAGDPCRALSVLRVLCVMLFRRRPDRAAYFRRTSFFALGNRVFSWLSYGRSPYPT
jgi:hypothetical protein